MELKRHFNLEFNIGSILKKFTLVNLITNQTDLQFGNIRKFSININENF